jgi:hypothetical protein
MPRLSLLVLPYPDLRARAGPTRGATRCLHQRADLAVAGADRHSAVTTLVRWRGSGRGRGSLSTSAAFHNYRMRSLATSPSSLSPRLENPPHYTH